MPKMLTQAEVEALPQGTHLMIRLRPAHPILRGTLNFDQGLPRFIHDPVPGFRGFVLQDIGTKAKAWLVDPIEA